MSVVEIPLANDDKPWIASSSEFLMLTFAGEGGGRVRKWPSTEIRGANRGKSCYWETISEAYRATYWCARAWDNDWFAATLKKTACIVLLCKPVDRGLVLKRFERAPSPTQFEWWSMVLKKPQAEKEMTFDWRRLNGCVCDKITQDNDIQSTNSKETYFDNWIVTVRLLSMVSTLLLSSLARSNYGTTVTWQMSRVSLTTLSTTEPLQTFRSELKALNTKLASPASCVNVSAPYCNITKTNRKKLEKHLFQSPLSFLFFAFSYLSLSLFTHAHALCSLLCLTMKTWWILNSLMMLIASL
jgi:hypothetical protein